MQEFNLVWSTPFVRKQLAMDEMLGDLRSVILENETAEKKHPSSPQKSHPALFESSFDFLSWPDPRIARFKEHFIAEVGKVVQVANNFSAAEMSKIRFGYHCWFHITRSGGYFPPHNHAMASWSAIFCVDAGDENIENDHACGKVTFYDPRFGANMYLDPANRNWRRDLTFNSVRFRLSPAELVVFPSYLTHSIDPYEGERPRLTIAANFWFHWDQEK